VRAGFTGTQQNITKMQWDTLCYLLERFDPEVCHHGDCIGADYLFHQAARQQGRRVVLHPPIDGSKRAFCQSDEVRPAKGYLDRNHDIVDETDFLIAAPKTEVEEQRSGTWSTVRYARKKNRPIYIIAPSGQVRWENV
jgi:hypothetical protein